MMRIARRFSGNWLVLLALTFLSLIWAYAVLHFGGIPAREWNLCVLALGTLAIGCALFLRPAESMPPLGPFLRWPLILLPSYVSLQIVPLPLTLVRVLSPARAALSDALAPVMAGAATTTLSVKVDATCEHLIRLLSYILVFLLIRRIAARLPASPWVTALPIVAVALLEAFIGIVQYAADPARNVAQGTYMNRNHFAGLLEMALPFATMLPVSVLLRSGFNWMTEIRTAAKVGLGFVAAFTILLGILQSLSRTGIVAAFFSLLVMGVLLLRHDLRGRARRIALIAAVGLIVLSFAIISSGRLAARFGALANYGALDSGIDRRMIWAQSMRVIADYPLVGCGLGGYQYTWLKYKTEMPLWATDFVHNDYMQLLSELGVAGFAILAALLIAILIRCMRATSSTVPAGSRHLAIACAASLAAILLHSLDDFNLYIPANAMLLAWIAGIAAGLPFRGAVLRHARVGLALLAFGFHGSAAVVPIGSMAGVGSLLLNGSDISTAGVLSWPIVSGDELATDAAPAVIMLHDSNRVFLEPRTHIRIQQRGVRTEINLLAGKLYFSVKRNFVLDFQASGHPVALAGATQGALSIENEGPLLKAGVPPPPLVLDSGVLKRRFPYGMGLPGMN